MNKLFIVLLLTFNEYAYSQLLAKQIQDAPSVEWSYTTMAPIFGSPRIFDDVVYFGSVDQYLYALELKTGQKLWQFKTGGKILSTPVLVDDNIIVNCGDGFLYCIDKNGKLLWKFATGGETKYHLYAYADYYHSSPITDSSMVYFGSGDHHIYAIDASTGKQVWKYKTGNVVHGTGSIDKENFYIGSFDGYLYALDKKTGSLKWKFKAIGHRFFPNGEMQGNSFVFGDHVYIGSRDYNLYAVDAKAGHGLWNLAFPKGWAMGSPVVHDSVLYVGTSDDMVLMALNPFTGSTKWKTELKFNVFGGVAIQDDEIYAGNLMGKLFANDKTSGNIIWEFKTEAYLQNRKKYFNQDDSYRKDIQSIITKGEDFLTMYYDLGAFFSTPVIHKSYLVVTSTDGNIYCFRLTK